MSQPDLSTPEMVPSSQLAPASITAPTVQASDPTADPPATMDDAVAPPVAAGIVSEPEAPSLANSQTAGDHPSPADVKDAPASETPSSQTLAPQVTQSPTEAPTMLSNSPPDAMTQVTDQASPDESLTKDVKPVTIASDISGDIQKPVTLALATPESHTSDPIPPPASKPSLASLASENSPSSIVFVEAPEPIKEAAPLSLPLSQAMPTAERMPEMASQNPVEVIVTKPADQFEPETEVLANPNRSLGSTTSINGTVVPKTVVFDSPVTNMENLDRGSPELTIAGNMSKGNNMTQAMPKSKYDTVVKKTAPMTKHGTETHSAHHHASAKHGGLEKVRQMMYPGYLRSWFRRHQRQRRESHLRPRKRDSMRAKFLSIPALNVIIGRKTAQMVMPIIEEAAITSQDSSRYVDHKLKSLKRGLSAKKHEFARKHHAEKADLHSQLGDYAQLEHFVEAQEFHVNRAGRHIEKARNHAAKEIRGRRQLAEDEILAAQYHVNRHEHHHGKLRDAAEKHSESSKHYEDKYSRAGDHLREARRNLEVKMERGRKRLESETKHLNHKASNPLRHVREVGEKHETAKEYSDRSDQRNNSDQSRFGREKARLIARHSKYHEAPRTNDAAADERRPEIVKHEAGLDGPASGIELQSELSESPH